VAIKQIVWGTEPPAGLQVVVAALFSMWRAFLTTSSSIRRFDRFAVVLNEKDGGRYDLAAVVVGGAKLYVGAFSLPIVFRAAYQPECHFTP
jgi:hypothetical protein